jgi:energy-coupling factor transporter transmembrane protein EcfT
MAIKSGHYLPWAYRKSNSPIHRLGGGLKLAFLFALSLGAFFPLIWVLPVIAVILSFLSLAASIKPWELLRGSRPLIVFTLFVFAFQAVNFLPLGINTEGAKEGIIFCLRIALSFSAGALLFSTTTMGEIKKALSRLESFLHLEKPGIALSFSLMLGFLPRIFETWEEVNAAWEARAGKAGISRIIKTLPPMMERLITKAAETADALEARGA